MGQLTRFQGAKQNQAARADLNLPHHLQRRLGVFTNRQTLTAPGVQTPFQHISLAIDSGRQAVAVGARPHAGAAGEDDLPRRLDLEAGAFETGKRPRQCAGDMGPGVFVRLTDINENGAADLQARSDFSRT